MADPSTASLPDNMALDGFDALSKCRDRYNSVDHNCNNGMQSNMECVCLSLLKMVMGDDGILVSSLCMLAA